MPSVSMSFTDKVQAVRTATAGGLPPTFIAAPLPLHSPAFIRSLLMTLFLPTADTLPTPQLKLVANLIAPFLTKLFNCSLSTATVPTVFKSALITPLIKNILKFQLSLSVVRVL